MHARRGRATPSGRRDHRCFDIDLHHDTTGHAGVHGVLDLADALDLEAAISDQARVLAELGSTESLDVRRSRAAGDLARRQPALDLAATPGADGGASVPRRCAPQRQIVLYLHLSDRALTGVATLGRVQNTAAPVLAEQIRSWCSQPHTQITVKPVIDLHESVSVHAYEVPDRIRERVLLRDLTCVFPWCNRTRVDCDHIVPHARGGPTATDNLAPLCRRHHRLKTHTGWTYVSIQLGRYEWTSPHGLRFLRDAGGTRELAGAP